MKISRRKLLAGSGVVLALPWLESLFGNTARASNPADPRRFVSLYMPDGTYNVKGDAPWHPPTGALSAATLPRVLSPFAQNIQDFSVLKYLSFNARDNAPGQGQHVNSVTTFLTQAAATDYNSTQCTLPVDSFDQMVQTAAKQPVTTPLVMSGGCQSGSVDNAPFNYSDYVSFGGGGSKPNQPNKNPVALFNAMFAKVGTGGSTPPPGPVPAAARNRSILDTATADLKSLQQKLGKNDAAKLDDYLTGLRAVETRLSSNGTPATVECVAGAAPDPTLDDVDIDGNYSDKYIARVQAFFDMIVLAFRCDIVRSVSFMYDGDGGERHNNPCPSGLLYNGADLSGGLHTGISHYGSLGSGGPGGPDRAVSRDRTYMYLFCYLLDALKKVQDPSGATILDNTIVFQAFGIADGNHDPGNADGTPVVVGGGKSFMHPGSSYDLGGADMVDLFYTFSTFLGMNLPNFRGSTRKLAI